MKASFETTILSISVSKSSSLVSQPARRARHQYLIRVQGILQLPSSTSWSGQLHHGVEEETARWKRPEQALPHGLQQARHVQRASRKSSAVHSQPQVAPGGHDGDPT